MAMLSFSTAFANTIAEFIEVEMSLFRKKDMIVATRSNSNLSSYIYAVRQDGTCIGRFDGRVSLPYGFHGGLGLDHAVSVGDIDGDGSLEVVALGDGCVAAWDRDGNPVFNFQEPSIFDDGIFGRHTQAPLLADVDGDGTADIVFSGHEHIFALHGDGTPVAGFPLTASTPVCGSMCISDIDNDGRNEIVAVTREDGNIFVWKTEGTTIEWGHQRFDSEATGEYVRGHRDPLVITSDTTWSGGSFPSDIYISSGMLTIPSGTTLQLAAGARSWSCRVRT